MGASVFTATIRSLRAEQEKAERAFLYDLVERVTRDAYDRGYADGMKPTGIADTYEKRRENHISRYVTYVMGADRETFVGKEPS